VVWGRCPTTGALGLVLYNVDRLTWGFSFHVPKFAGRHELFVVCDALICDSQGAPGADSSQTYCDRSCMRPSSDLTPTTTAAAEPPVRARRLAPLTLGTDDDVTEGISTSFQTPIVSSASCFCLLAFFHSHIIFTCRSGVAGGGHQLLSRKFLACQDFFPTRKLPSENFAQ